MLEIIRDDEKMARNLKIGRYANFAGLAILGFGLFLSFQGDGTLFIAQWIALLLGIMMWQVSLFFTQRFGRLPRVDQVLDENVRSNYTSHLYHYILPASHVMLTRSGVMVFAPHPQSGGVTASGEEGDKWSWNAPFFKKFLGTEMRLGNPTLTTQGEVARIVKFINEKAPEIEEVPIAPVIVFTNPEVVLDAKASRIPAVKAKELKQLVRKNTGRAMPKEQYNRLREIFNAEAGDLVEGG